MITVGVDIGGTKALAVRMDGTDVVAETRLDIDRSTGTVDAVIRSIESVFVDDVEAIGVGVAGLVSQKDGTLRSEEHTSELQSH